MTLPEGVPLGLWLGVMLLLREREPEQLLLAPTDREAVGLDDRVELPLRVLLGVLAAVLLPV